MHKLSSTFTREEHEKNCKYLKGMLPHHDKRYQLTFLTKLSYHLKMFKGDDMYLTSSQTFNYHNLKPKIRPPQI